MHTTHPYRGLMSWSHSAKVVYQLLASRVVDAYTLRMPASQHGAVRMRGPDFAAHTSHAFWGFSRAKARPYCVVSVGVAKAFDSAVREVVFGWPFGLAASSRVESLGKLGLGPNQASSLCAFVQATGDHLRQWGVSEGVIHAIAGQHEYGWANVRVASSEIEVKLSGRQGCVFGTVVFNSADSLVLRAVEKVMRDEAVAWLLPAASPDFGRADLRGNECAPSPVCQVALVDDVAVMVSRRAQADLN